MIRIAIDAGLEVHGEVGSKTMKQQGDERIALQHGLALIGLQETGRIVAADAERRLGEIVGPETEELGGAIVFLASDASSYMTGAEVVFDGGYLLW